MSNILAVDCCIGLTGTALMTNGRILGIDQQDLGRRQSGELPLMAERLMKNAGLAFRELDYIALTTGPGYFTGIRVGASYASGLAYASGAGIIPVSSLELLNFTYTSRAGKGGNLLVMVYAGHGYVYALGDSLPENEYSHSEILSWLEANPNTKIISDNPERIALGISMHTVKPDMSCMCELAMMKLDEAVSPMNLAVSYYRAPQGVK